MILTTIGGYEIGSVSDLDFLIGPLRVHLGDVVSPFTFSDGFLRRTLVDAFKALTLRWQSRYVLTSTYLPSGINYIVSGIDYHTYTVSRNLLKSSSFVDSEPPVIQYGDERALILMASIIIKRGSQYSSAASFGSWRDDELSYSNIESGKTYQTSLKDDLDELNSLLPSRGNKLAKTRKSPLGGFGVLQGNYYEGGD